MTSPQIVQLISIALFVCGAYTYYNIRRTLYKEGYPVSIFVYSGPCWKHYQDLITKSEPAEQHRLKFRKRFMILCMALAIASLILSSVIARGG